MDQESKNEEDGDEDEDENDNDYPESLQYVVPFEKDKPRWSIRWRTNNNPEFTSRVFKASYTLGLSSTVLSQIFEGYYQILVVTIFIVHSCCIGTNDDPRGIF